jgi:hypothetical protein
MLGPKKETAPERLGGRFTRRSGWFREKKLPGPDTGVLENSQAVPREIAACLEARTGNQSANERKKRNYENALAVW